MSEQDCENDAAAYVLGALDANEAAAFERHLETCASCRENVAAYDIVADALPTAIEQHTAPRALRRRVLSAVHAEPNTHTRSTHTRPQTRSRHRLEATIRSRRIVTLAGAAVLALALAAGIELSDATHTRSIQASVGAARIALTGDHAQLLVEHLPTPTPGHIYELWLQRGDAAPSPSTLFNISTRGTADVALPGTVHGLRRVLVTNEPAGGTSAPTTVPVIVATLS